MLIQIQDYKPEYSEILAKVFEKSILAIDDRFYSHEQKLAWNGNRSLDFWEVRFAKSLPIVALYQANIAGFAEFLVHNNQGEIDCFYIDPNYQGLGIGKALLTHILTLEKVNQLDLLSVNASYNAKPFFEKYGFETVQKNVVKRENIELQNWLMICNLEEQSNLNNEMAIF